MKHVIFSALVLVNLACGSSDSARATATEASNGPKNPGGGNTITTSSKKKISVTEEHPIGMSLSDIKVYLEGSSDTVKFKDTDPVSDMIKGDLDKDGFDEVYIITSTAGSGSYGKVLGVASLADSSLQQIQFPSQEQGAKPIPGYMGGDKYSIDGVTLLRSFQLYSEEDTQAKPTGTIKMLKYGLVKKGNKYLLLELNP